MSRRAILLTSVVVLVSAVILYRIITLIATGIVVGHVMGARFCNYQPIDPTGQPLAQWSETVDRVRFSMRPLSLSLSSHSTVCLDITNESDKEVVLLGGQVLTYGRSIEANVLDRPEEVLLRTVPAGQSKDVCLSWELGTWLDQVLGQEITWIWRVRIGKAEHLVRIPMQRK